MAGILDSFKRLFKRRQHQRYFVKDETFVIISLGNGAGREQKVQVIDISHGGMAFIYKGSSSELETSGVLKLLSMASEKEVKFETVSDVPVPGSTQTSEPFRRRGVKFKWLGFYEQKKLKDLVDKVKLCEK